MARTAARRPDARTDQRDPPWVAIAAAAVGAAGVVVAALLARSPAGPDVGAEPAAASTPGGSGPVVELASIAVRPAEPPPSVSLVFVGRWEHLEPTDAVFVLVESTDLAQSPGSGGGASSRYLVSQPAELSPDGTWEVVWVFQQEPGESRFSAVVVRRPVTSDGGNPGGGPVPSTSPSASSTAASPEPGAPPVAPLELTIAGIEARVVAAADTLRFRPQDGAG